MSSAEQLAARASHLLAPYLSDLVAEPAMAADASVGHARPLIPDLTAKVWRLLSATAAAGAHDLDLKLIMLEASMPNITDPTVMRSLSAEIQQLLEANPGLSKNLETLWTSMSQPGV